MDGCQIDLLIDRDDQVINLCEIKWAGEAYVLPKSYATELRNKIALFRHYSKTKKQIFLTFISTFGLVKNEHSLSLVDKELTLDSLFSPE